MSRVIIKFIVGDHEGFSLVLTGRDAWALAELVRAGKKGCTPITHPGPRWSAYVFNLRHEYGLIIETVNEAHGGKYSGTHARYVLKTPVRILDGMENAA